MAIVSNPVLTTWCNQELRPLNNTAMGVIQGMVQLVADYQAKGLAAILAGASPTDTIDDGSIGSTPLYPQAADGRVAMEVVDITAILAAITALDTALSTPDGTGTAPIVRMQKILVGNPRNPISG